VINKVLYRTFLAIITGCGIALIIISPLGLEELASAKRLNWARLSNVGQTYGAVSALIGGIALAAVAISLILQARGLTLSRMQMTRTFHLDLIKFSIENPWLIQSWGDGPLPGSTMEDFQRTGFVNVIAWFWMTSYHAGTISADELHANFSGIFNGEAGRRWWIGSRDQWLRAQSNRRIRHALSIAQEEFDKAVDKGPPLVTTAPWDKHQQNDSVNRRVHREHQGTKIALAFVAGIIAAGRVTRKRRSAPSGCR
jgi:Family of unknown function (DUF6082)